jgi:multisubunit Na+/H+ antiporter MnhC subunit
MLFLKEYIMTLKVGSLYLFNKIKIVKIKITLKILDVGIN